MTYTYPTPHNTAVPGDFAETVLMPGDPLRSKFIAETYLKDAKLVNNIRGVQGYTGTYKGTRVSVMASGMGMPSMGIYSYELFDIYNVENIIRIGTTGTISPDVKMKELIVAMGASTNSNFASQYRLNGTYSAIANYELMHQAIVQAQKAGIPYHVGNVLSYDSFYCADETLTQQWSQLGILSYEMESAALYMNAAYCRKRALAILTVSDDCLTGEQLPAEERQYAFTQMIEVALETAIAVK